MSDVISDLKAHARVLHRRARTGDRAAIQRLRVLPQYAKHSDTQVVESLQRRDCLTAVARQLGFTSWTHAKEVLSGKEQRDFGTMLYPSSCYGHWNIWSASYEEACDIRAAHGGYLLAYRHQFLIVDAHYVESMGLDPADPDWERIARDWVHPKDTVARARLYRQLIHNALVALVLRETPITVRLDS